MLYDESILRRVFVSVQMGAEAAVAGLVILFLRDYIILSLSP